MKQISPYSCTTPGKSFVGYQSFKEDVLYGLRNGGSYAVLGGRRCGKTSMLLELETILNRDGLPPFEVRVHRLNVQRLTHRSEEALFKELYEIIATGTSVAEWKMRDEEDPYKSFLLHLDAAASVFQKKYGSNWLVVLLLDELDSAMEYLASDSFFGQLRDLLTESRFHGHIRLVATGVRELASLIRSGSPLNCLRTKYLRVLNQQKSSN